VRLKIVREKRGASTVIHVDGQLLAEGLPELKRTFEPEDRAVCLDFEHLISIDAAGIEEIRRMVRDGGVRVVNASPYIKLLLQVENSFDKSNTGGHHD
jgi:hypothetical protein